MATILPQAPQANLRVGLVQMRCSGDLDDNLGRALEFVEQAAREGAQVVCLQELFRAPYPCQSEDPARFEWAEPVPGPTSEVLCKRAAELGVALVASLFVPSLLLHTNYVFFINGSFASTKRWRRRRGCLLL